MYKIYIDKNELFEATIRVDGLESNIKPKCRLVLESSKFNLLFEGTIQNNKCTIPIKKLKEILSDGDTGNLRLEVIADDTFFTPWEQEFSAQLSKKLTVEVKTSEQQIIKPKLSVTTIVESKVSASDLKSELNRKFVKNNINITNVPEKRTQIRSITESILQNEKFSKLKLSEEEVFNIVLKSLPIINQ